MLMSLSYGSTYVIWNNNALWIEVNFSYLFIHFYIIIIETDDKRVSHQFANDCI